MKGKEKVTQHDMFKESHKNDSNTDDSDVASVLDDEPAWPNHERFPYNRSKKDGGVKRAGEWIIKDLEINHNLLIITGFTSLGRIVSFLSKCFQRNDLKDSIRILIGKEPRLEQIREVRIGGDAVDSEIRSYLLAQQLSIYQCYDVMQALKMLSLNHTQVRVSRNAHRYVHAKIYKTDTTITFGSSNFSEQGLEKLTEVNLRLSRQARSDEKLAREMSRYAEKIWEISRDYKSRLCKLLEGILQEVSWSEALARGCAELLEGEWAKRYIESATQGNKPNLWSFQIQGIAEALYIIENVGGVLVADATGSGKTKMGTALLKSVLYKLWSDPIRLLNQTPVLLSPPKVLALWDRTTSDFGYKPELFSHGAMSNPRSGDHKRLVRAIRYAQVIVVDEAHNFLNRQSRRSQLLTRNMADHVLLFTATPVNQGPDDLFRMVMLLGPDNFDDDIVDTLEDILGNPRRIQSKSRLIDEKLASLQSAIKQFTIRRTKQTINQLIDTYHKSHIDNTLKICKYPEHITCTYKCGETLEDQHLAEKIYETAKQLKGLLWLRKPLKKARYNYRTDDQFLEQRLRGAKGLAVHIVMDCLRSSRAALLEHLHGTVKASQIVGLAEVDKPKETGNVIARLREIASNPQPPKNLLTQASLPDWLRDPSSYCAACEEEINLYEQIGSFVEQISTSREHAKVGEIQSLLKTHQQILAFDRHIISLYYFQSLLGAAHCEVLVATGDSKTESAVQKLQRLLDPNIDDKDKPGGVTSVEVVGLCSDALAEGVNLQKASAVVLLDMPTVIRRAEQRIGRIDRVDSPHKKIESRWPQDSSAFAPKADEEFFERLLFVQDVLGSNIEIPDEWNIDQISEVKLTSPDEIIGKLRYLELEPEEDAFAPIRALVTGKSSLIDPQIYVDMRGQSERVRTAVKKLSFVSSATETAWAFLAIKGENGSAPRLVFFASLDTNPITKLDEIADALRSRLTKDTPRRSFDHIADEFLKGFALRLTQTERLLLSRKKQRVLEEMLWLLRNHPQLQKLSKARKPQDRDIEVFLHSENLDLDNRNIEESEDKEFELVEKLLHVLNNQYQNEEDMIGRPTIDWNVLAERWLNFIRPTFQEYLEQPGLKKKLIRLKDIRPMLKAKHIMVADLEKLLKPESLWTAPLDQRIVSAIVGVPDL